MGLKAQILLPGKTASAPCLALTAPISFWGGVDPRSGEIIDARHPQRGRTVAGTVLALPGTIGSSSASARTPTSKAARTARRPRSSTSSTCATRSRCHY